MESIDVEGATGNVHTNYDGKATAAIDAFKRGKELVYVHVEGPDECGHRAEIDNKVKSVELIDKKILLPVYNYLKESGEPFKIMILPDHPTPIRIRTHSMDPVPFMIYSSENETDSGISTFNEKTARKTVRYNPNGFTLMDGFIEK
jgi:2,3-bisphosphoglycerate-independent phosphoglycerate mutase